MKPDKKWYDSPAFVASLPKGGIAAELGVWRGSFARMSYDVLKPEKMYLVDWWAPYSNSGGDKELWSKVRGQAFDKFKKEIAAKRVEVIEEDFTSAALHIPNDYLDYIRHDGDEREIQVDRAFRAWWPKLKKGGIWLGHGFENDAWHGTIKAVIKFLKANPEAELLTVLLDHSHYVIRKNV